MKSDPTPEDLRRERRLEWFRRQGAPYEARIHANLNRALWKTGEPLPVGGGAPQLPTILSALRGSTVKNTFTTAATLLNADNTGPFSSDYFNVVGATWSMEAMGIVGTTGTPTLQFLVVGGTAAVPATMLAQTAATATLTGLANITYYAKAIGKTVAATGSTSTILVQGFILGFLWSATLPYTFVTNATPPTAVTLSLVAGSVFLDFQAAWGTSSASNTITTNAYALTSLSS